MWRGCSYRLERNVPVPIAGNSHTRMNPGSKLRPCKQHRSALINDNTLPLGRHHLVWLLVEGPNDKHVIRHLTEGFPTLQLNWLGDL